MMCNLQLHKSPKLTYLHIKTLILTTCIYFSEYNGTLNLYVYMTMCFIITRYSNITKVPSFIRLLIFHVSYTGINILYLEILIVYTYLQFRIY
jgi:hypothetical protein